VQKKHGIRVESVYGTAVEAYVLAIADIVNAKHIVAASRMHSGIVVFFDDEDCVDTLCVEGLVVGDSFLKVSSLERTPRRVVLSNVPPFLPSYELLDALR
jgi:hypothetical protein